MALEREKVEVRLREALASRDEILEAYLFGSVARGEARAHSDVDVAVFVDAATVRDDGFGYEATLSADLANVLGTDRVDVAGFRNVLVHGYLEVDLARVHAVLNERLLDFAEFARRVDAYVSGA